MAEVVAALAAFVSAMAFVAPQAPPARGTLSAVQMQVREEHEHAFVKIEAAALHSPRCVLTGWRRVHRLRARPAASWHILAFHVLIRLRSLMEAHEGSLQSNTHKKCLI